MHVLQLSFFFYVKPKLKFIRVTFEIKSHSTYCFGEIIKQYAASPVRITFTRSFLFFFTFSINFITVKKNVNERRKRNISQYFSAS